MRRVLDVVRFEKPWLEPLLADARDTALFVLAAPPALALDAVLWPFELFAYMSAL